MSDFDRHVMTRDEILSDIRKKIVDKVPIIVGGAGAGLVAKMEEKAGVDMILCTSGDVFIMDGIDPAAENYSWGNCNDMTASIAERNAKIVRHVPVIAGIGAADPRRNLKRYIFQLTEIGVSGVMNAPGMGSFYHTSFREMMDKNFRGFNLECEMIGFCRKHDIFTMGVAYDADEACQMAAAGADVVVAKMGDVPYAISDSSGKFDIKRACALTNEMIKSARNENPDVLVFSAGGGIDSAETLKTVFENTDSQGFVGSECIEAAPLRREINADIRAFLNLKVRVNQ